ncbi:ferredoxin--NADP reductase [Neisseria leonii]|uniref:ferredoxin--NADP(+) reductase n=1 Tax=Neisseria leonii TaxID=2995413 RepID=A0A9X4E3N4_9NEIS|nr:MULTISPECIES: ferredoxin--NADP reductase [unclassified Neisseria]MDD9325082.1 ferredoxin--NADP reductase [Neisseria sp. 3986]MDD9327376.1 ferredoxin--NADP reductase [Neisseria sp. 51.81]
MTASPEAKYTEETVLRVERHTPKLMTFVVSRPESYRFAAGQFSRLGFRDGEGYIWRAYSVVSAEYDEELVYFAVLIENGPMSARLAQLQAGDRILLDKTATGFLLPERFADGRDLVMLSTGSGIAPFLSVVRQPQIWQRFDSLTLVHSVSYRDELVFNRDIAALAQHPLIEDDFHKLTFIPVLTRDQAEGALCGKRLPERLKDGSLARAAGRPFTAEDTRFMICGNPAMVKDTFQALLDMGFAMHRNRIPGQILMENGF